MVDKNFCMSSYLAFRYIEKDGMDFFEGLKHKNFIPQKEKIFVKNEYEIDNAIKNTINRIKNEKIGIMLSGGMDSACLASYLPGCDAYTFRFLNGNFQEAELQRAEYYAKRYNLNLHYVDIGWDDVVKYLPIVMKSKNAPVHSIEPQIYKAAIQAKADGITLMIVGESADLVFGGMDQLLAKDWKYNEFKNRYIFCDPYAVLNNPVDMDYLFARYKKLDDKIDFLAFMDDVFSIESSSSYYNAFGAAGMNYLDPYANLKMSEELDLNKVRSGQSKYLIRALFKMKYPEIEVPNKVPMPRPVDSYFTNWAGPKRKEFKKDLDISKFTGNQKWQMYCLEEFLNYYE